MKKGFEPVDIDETKWEGEYVTSDISGTGLVFIGTYLGREIYVQMAIGETLAHKKQLVEHFGKRLTTNSEEED